MSHRTVVRRLVLAGAAAALLTACDVEPSSAMNHDVVTHVDLARLKKAPWVKKALDGGNFDINASSDGKIKSEHCNKLLDQADALTVGLGNHLVEVYVAGALDRKQTEACFDELEAGFAKKAKDKTAKGKPDVVRTEVIGDDLIAVLMGQEPLPTPSRARLKDLLDAEPSQSGNEPLWFTVQNGPKSDDMKYAEGWANATAGLDAHVQVEFKDEATAAKLAAEATIALTAMKFSDETRDIASAIKLTAAGDTITADVKASDKQMKQLVAATEGKADSKGSSATIKIETK